MRLARFALIAALAVLPAASAQAATVSGSVAGGKGYTVLALAASGQASSAKVGSGGAFSLKLPGKGATLQLVKPTGAYFGPVVLRKAGKRALMTLSAKGGKLGKVKLKAGYASAKAPKKAVSPKGAIRTKHGAPLGAGNLGFVKMKGRGKARIASAGDNGVGADPDGDGVPSTFDADDNGNKTLDGVDPQSAKASTAGLFSDVQVMMARSINANAGGIDTAQVDAFVKSNMSLNFYLDDHYAGGPATTVSAVNVDCGRLVYCRPGDGTALMGDGGNSPTGAQNQPWATYDNDHDGLPDVPANTNGGGSSIHSIEVRPNVGTADIHAGDLYQVRYTTPGGVVTVPTALAFYFVSSPALSSYDAGAGTVPVSYPIANSAPGSDQNPIVMSGDKIALSFWRPQRAGLGSEPQFMDMGHLRYGIAMSGGNHELRCGTGAYSNLSPSLAAAPGVQDEVYNALFPLVDGADDAAPNRANLLHFTFDLGGCLRANGVDTTQMVRMPLEAVDESRPGGTDRTALTISVCLPGCTPPSNNGPGDNQGPQQGGSAPQGSGGKPDLAIDSVTGTDNGGGCNLTVTIANRGTAMAPPSSVSITAGGGASATFQAQNIDAGGHGTATGSIAGACPGQSITATADSAGAIDEYAEDNNIWSGTLPCPGRRAVPGFSPRTGC